MASSLFTHSNHSGDSDLSSLLGGMSQEQLLRLIGGVGNLGGGNTAAGLSNAIRGAVRPASAQSQESTTPARVQSAPEAQTTTGDDPMTPQPRPVTAAALPSGSDPSRAGAQSIQLSDLQSVLSSIHGSKSILFCIHCLYIYMKFIGFIVQLSLGCRCLAISTSLGRILTLVAVSADDAQQPVNLLEALSAEKMIPILTDPGVQERLTPYLPQDASIPSSQEELQATVASPQFQQALTSFSTALSSGQLGPVLTQFGLGQAAIDAANKGGEFPVTIISIK